MAVYKDLFEMQLSKDDKEKGLLTAERIVEMMQDMTCDKVDSDQIEELVKAHAVKKPEDADEDYPDMVNYATFLKIAVMYLNESQSDDEVKEAFDVLEKFAFQAPEGEGFTEEEMRYLLSHIAP